MCQGDFNDHGLWSEDSQDRPSAQLTALGTTFFAFSFQNFHRNWMIPFRFTMRDIFKMSVGVTSSPETLCLRAQRSHPCCLLRRIQPEVKKLTVGDYVKAAEMIEFRFLFMGFFVNHAHWIVCPCCPSLKFSRKGASLVLETFCFWFFQLYHIF